MPLLDEELPYGPPGLADDHLVRGAGACGDVSDLAGDREVLGLGDALDGEGGDGADRDERRADHDGGIHAIDELLTRAIAEYREAGLAGHRPAAAREGHGHPPRIWLRACRPSLRCPSRRRACASGGSCRATSLRCTPSSHARTSRAGST